MANVSINAALNQVIRNFEQMRGRFQRSMQQRQGDRLAARALAALKTVPGDPIEPAKKMTDRQRKAFFASDGFGRGIPARRGSPPAVTAGWGAEFIATEDGGIVALTNTVPHMKYVQGDRAQPFHLDTGWVQLDDVREDAFREMEGVAVQEWFLSADPLDGI